MADRQPRRDAPAEGFANHIGRAAGDGPDELGHYVGDVDHTCTRSKRRPIEAWQRRHQQSEVLGNAFKGARIVAEPARAMQHHHRLAVAGLAVLNLAPANIDGLLKKIHSAACFPLPSSSDWWRYRAKGF